ncbi:hypothetical protein ACFMPD_11610 [Sedimentitalea sp. HM32M-2]|uniref:hypothetical protein n=1 Tax=Sedimentitalea sp. HM32M-2 TaxID=3351566 RepID=UPI003627A7BD
MNTYLKLCALAAAVLPLSACVETSSPTGEASGAEAVAATNCISQVDATVGVNGSSVNDVTVLDDGFSLLMKVPGAEDFWVCETSPSGAVTSVFYMGGG